MEKIEKIEKRDNFPPVCEGDEIHIHEVRRAKDGMPSEEMLEKLTELFKVFGDKTRMNILYALDKGPLCVCDICEILGMTKSAVSHQLKILRQSALVSYNKSGRNVYYSLADEHVRTIIEIALEHLMHI